MKVEIIIRNSKAYLVWVKNGMSHIVRDKNEAKVFSETRARQLKKMYAHKKAKLIKC